MLFLTVASILVVALVVAVLVAVFGPGASKPDRYGRGNPGVKGRATLSAAVLALLLVVVTLAFSATTVGARSVGVQTAFGRYQDTLQSGFQMTAPWSSVEEFSTRIQPLDLDGKDQNVDVNFKGGGQGEVNATVRWFIDTKNARALWEKYKTFDNVRDQLVRSSAQDSFRIVIGKYSPNEARAGENLRPISDSVKADLGALLAPYGVKVDSVSVKGISLDRATQNSLEKIVVANNDIERANSEQARARIDAETARIRQNAGVLSGPALVRYCLEVTNAWDQGKNGPLPAGWSCLGGQDGVVALTNTPPPQPK